MNFLCQNCKQKYHVSDEKLRGRAVTKFKCKKCEHIIEVKASDVPPPGAPGSDNAEFAGSESIPPAGGTTGTMAALVAPKPAPLPSATVSPAPSVTAAPKPAFGSTPSKPVGSSLPTAAPRPNAPNAPNSASASGGASLPTSRGSSSPMGAVGTAASSATAAKISPIGSAKPITSTAPTSAISSKPSSPTNPSNPSNNALRSSLTQGSESRATTSNSATTSAQTDGPRRKDSSTSALLNSSETGWYAGVRDVPVGPLTRAEMLAKIDAGDVTAETLVWREGLDDWRALQQVNELRDLLREASKKIGENIIGTGAKKSTPPNNVVSISRANPAKDAVDEPEESTRLTSLSDLIATAEGAATKKKPPISAPPAPSPAKPRETKPPVASEPKAEVKAEVKTEPARPAVLATPPPTAAAEDSLDDEFFKKASAKSSAAASVAEASPAPPNATKEPAKDAFVFAAPAVQAAPPAAAATTGSVVAMSAGLASITPSVAPPAKSAKTAEKSGVPMGVWVLVGGLVIAAGGGGLFAGTRINQPPAVPVVQPTVQPTVQPPTNPTPRLDPQIGANINVNTPEQTPPVVPPANVPAVTQATATGPSTPTTNTARPHTGTTPTAAAHNTGSSAGGLTAEQRAEMARLLGGNPAGGVGPGTGGPTVSARTSTGQETAAPVAGPTGSMRATQVLETFNRTGVIRSCWQQQITRNPAHPAERLSVTLTVGQTGRASEVRVTGSTDPALATCISNRARSQNFGPGGQIDAQANFNLAIGQ